MKSLVVYESLWGNTASRCPCRGRGTRPRRSGRLHCRGHLGGRLDRRRPRRRRRAGVRLQAVQRRRCVQSIRDQLEKGPHAAGPLRARRCVPGSPRCPPGAVGQCRRVRHPGQGSVRQGRARDRAAARGRRLPSPSASPPGFVVKGKYGPLKDGRAGAGPRLGRGAGAGSRGPSQKPEALRQSLPGRRRGALLPRIRSTSYSAAIAQAARPTSMSTQRCSSAAASSPSRPTPAVSIGCSAARPMSAAPSTIAKTGDRSRSRPAPAARASSRGRPAAAWGRRRADAPGPDRRSRRAA